MGCSWLRRRAKPLGPLLAALGMLVPSAVLPSGGLWPCSGALPPPVEPPTAVSHASGPAYVPPPAPPQPILPPGLDTPQIGRLMREVLGLDFDLGHRFVLRYGRFFQSVAEVEEFRSTGKLAGARPGRPAYRTWPERPTGTPLAMTSAGFEGSFSDRGAPEVTVAEGWQPWFQPTIKPGYNHRPEYKPEPYRVRSGEQAQKMFTTYATHDAGLAQAIRVRPGDRLRFSIWVNVWSSSHDDPRTSDRPGSYCVQVGIDDVWSSPVEVYDRWVRVEVAATARSGTVVLRTRGFAEHPVKHNDSYWDDALLEVLEPAR